MFPELFKRDIRLDNFFCVSRCKLNSSREIKNNNEHKYF